ncbi:hypothetical protein [Rhizobium halophilum]|uniref:hypothetical protein n=1 Tax=Rhizobium halophilum TaxID=2846852 RepID=UPI001EFEEB7F|nr:hypothetical protein [Rhizobium halophilum]MCF6367379.1 hypothetical protein [Rhizobium halophilum]
MAAISFSEEPEIVGSDSRAQQHPLRPVFIGVLAAKVFVAAILLTTVSTAPPVTAEASYLASLQ